jgi:hypothetical protein
MYHCVQLRRNLARGIDKILGHHFYVLLKIVLETYTYPITHLELGHETRPGDYGGGYIYNIDPT